MGTDGNIRMLRKINPNVLIGMPTFVYHVLREAALDGVRCDNLRGIVLGGEKVPQGLRRKLQESASVSIRKASPSFRPTDSRRQKWRGANACFPWALNRPDTISIPIWGLSRSSTRNGRAQR